MKTKRTRQYLFIILLCCTLIMIVMKFIGYHNKEDNGFVGFVGRLLNRTNSFKVTYNNVEKKDFDVIWHIEDGNIDTLVYKGNTIRNFGYEYGREKFIILYKGKPLCSNEFFSTNNNDAHEVGINISKPNESFIVTYTIDKRKSSIIISTVNH